jgi:uncharacterized protein YecE (DUF72 family)
VTRPKKNAQTHGQVYVGCSGWAYPSWKPEFYPSNTPAKKLLDYYATRLNSVEVNYTFRSLPSRSIAQNWLHATGADFRFCFKAPQRITHILRLKNCRDALLEFADSISPVVAANRVGPILFQLPPNARADVDRLATFLSDAASLKLRLTFEFRHESWFCREVYSTLRAHCAALCVAESDDLVTPDEYTAPFTCYRFRKSRYSAQALTAVRAKLLGRAPAGDVFAYFKHEETPIGALRALRVSKGLERA